MAAPIAITTRRLHCGGRVGNHHDVLPLEGVGSERSVWIAEWDVRIAVFSSAIVIDVIVHCHTAW